MEEEEKAPVETIVTNIDPAGAKGTKRRANPDKKKLFTPNADGTIDDE